MNVKPKLGLGRLLAEWKLATRALADLDRNAECADWTAPADELIAAR